MLVGVQRPHIHSEVDIVIEPGRKVRHDRVIGPAPNRQHFPSVHHHSVIVAHPAAVGIDVAVLAFQICARSESRESKRSRHEYEAEKQE